MSDDLDPEQIHAQALATAADRQHYFQGSKLEPFSFGRQSAAQRLSMSDESQLEAATLLIYLCTLGEGPFNESRETGIDRIDRARGEKELRIFRQEMAKWADGKKIRLGSTIAKEIQSIANDIWTDLLVSETIPSSDSGGIATGPKKHSL